MEKKILFPKKRDFDSLKGGLVEKGRPMQALCNLPCHQVCKACSCKVRDETEQPLNRHRF